MSQVEITDRMGDNFELHLPGGVTGRIGEGGQIHLLVINEAALAIMTDVNERLTVLQGIPAKALIKPGLRETIIFDGRKVRELEITTTLPLKLTVLVE